MGPIRNVEFIRQETAKRRLSDAHLSLDMPILFTFEKDQVLLWIMEFQEDKHLFSIYKMLRYAGDLMEKYPDALMIPTVLFTDRNRWRTDVQRQVSSKKLSQNSGSGPITRRKVIQKRSIHGSM